MQRRGISQGSATPVSLSFHPMRSKYGGGEIPSCDASIPILMRLAHWVLLVAASVGELILAEDKLQHKYGITLIVVLLEKV